MNKIFAWLQKVLNLKLCNANDEVPEYLENPKFLNHDILDGEKVLLFSNARKFLTLDFSK